MVEMLAYGHLYWEAVICLSRDINRLSKRLLASFYKTEVAMKP